MVKRSATWKAALRSIQSCPALPLAVMVAAGQLLMWFLHVPEAAILAVVAGIGMVSSAGFYRIALAGVVVGLLSGACAAVGRVGVLSGDDVSFQGVITQEPRHPRTGEVVFTVRALSIAGNPVIRARAVELPWRNSADLRRGDVLWLRGVLTGTERPTNPFSWQGWLYRRGIAGELKARWLSQPIHPEPGPISALRARAEEVVADRYRERRGGALFLSMALGYQDKLSAYVESALKRVGLTHLLVVSGYQVSLVFLCVTWILRRLVVWIVRGCNARAWVPAVSLLVSAVYVAFVGLEASAVRALLAAGCVCAAVVGERGSKFSQRWAVSLLCIQILMPWAVCDIGVQLTFAALGGIGIGSALGKGRTVITYLYVALCTWLFTGCVLAVWGGLLAPAGFLFNILLATPWSVLNCVVGSLGFLLLLLCGEWGCGVLDLVVVLNEVVAEWMVYCADGILGRAFQPEGRARVVTVALLALCSVALCVWAATRARLSIIRELVV